MKFKTKDKIAMGPVAVAVAVYVGYLAFGGLPWVPDVRAMAALALVLGLASRRIGGADAFAHRRAARLASIACVALGFTAFFTENAVVLAVFMGLSVALSMAAIFALLRSAPERLDGSQRPVTMVKQ